METMKKATELKPVLTQVQNNTTYWIGHMQSDPINHVAGQTFRCPADGELDNIQVLSSVVQYPGELVLTLHHFDTKNKTWGPALGKSSVKLEKDNVSKWIQFRLQPVKLEKDRTYAFRLQTPNAYVAIGEAATVKAKPFTYGQEWTASSDDKIGHYFTYFSLAFKVELRA
jgi:hypothetical protein